MAEEINIVAVSGNLTHQPKLFGDGVVRFTLAHNRRFKSRGRWVTNENFFHCVLRPWRKALVRKVLSRAVKGASLSVQAHLESYPSDPDNGHHDMTVLIVHSVKFGERSKPP